jgi:hypothetical protein
MFGISHITVSGKNKSKEEIKKEILEQVDKQVEEMFNANKKKEEAKKEPEVKENQHLHIMMDEVDNKNGFNCEVDTNGKLNDLMAMLICGTATALKELLGEENPGVAKFLEEVAKQYLEEDEDGEEEE